MTWRNEYEKSVLLFTKHCIIDAKIAVGFDAEITAPENAKNTAFVIPGYTCRTGTSSEIRNDNLQVTVVFNAKRPCKCPPTNNTFKNPAG